MSAPKVKVYGLFWMTRKTYLTIQITGLVIVLAIMAVIASWHPPEAPPGEHLPPVVAAIVFFLDYLPWITFGVLLLVGIETWIILAKFKRLEAQQKALAELNPPPSGEPGASATGGRLPPVADAPGSPANP
jgi:hypothetical protein